MTNDLVQDPMEGSTAFELRQARAEIERLRELLRRAGLLLSVEGGDRDAAVDQLLTDMSAYTTEVVSRERRQQHEPPYNREARIAELKREIAEHLKEDEPACEHPPDAIMTTAYPGVFMCRKCKTSITQQQSEPCSPPPPDVLADTLQDVVHKDTGPVRAGRSVKSRTLAP